MLWFNRLLSQRSRTMRGRLSSKSMTAWLLSPSSAENPLFLIRPLLSLDPTKTAGPMARHTQHQERHLLLELLFYFYFPFSSFNPRRTGLFSEEWLPASQAPTICPTAETAMSLDIWPPVAPEELKIKVAEAQVGKSSRWLGGAKKLSKNLREFEQAPEAPRQRRRAQC